MRTINPAAAALRRAPWVMAMLLALLCPLTLAQDALDPEAVPITVTVPYINLRTGPGRGYPAFHVAEKRQVLYLIKRRGDWYKVATATGIKGWVWRADLHDSRDADGAPLDFSVPGWEGYIDQRWEMGLSGGSFSRTEALGVHLGYRMTQHLSTELKYTQAFGNFSDSKLASINVVHRPFPEWRVSPFFILGTGTIKTSPSAALVEAEDRQDNLFSVGGGFIFYLSHRFALRAEYNQHTVLTTRQSNEEVDEWKAGFSVSF